MTTSAVAAASLAATIVLLDRVRHSSPYEHGLNYCITGVEPFTSLESFAMLPLIDGMQS